MKTVKLGVVVLFVLTLFSCGMIFGSDHVQKTTWSVTFNWSIAGSGTADITFNKDGTNDWGGTWAQTGKDVSWTYVDASRTATYTGVVDGDLMSGTCSNTTGDTGIWTAEKN